MTKRAIIISILFVLLLTTLGIINDYVLLLEPVSNGHQLPIVVLGSLIVFSLVLNPLVGKIRPKAMLKPAELAVILCICSCACGIGGRAFMEHFPQIVTMPHHWIQTDPGWKQRAILERFPKDSLVTPVPYDETVTRFVTGTDSAMPAANTSWLARAVKKTRSVPWKQWLAPIKTWLPMMMLISIAMTALAVIVHKQWSQHEHLQYPIANFFSILISRKPEHTIPDIFYNRLFWTAFALIFLMRLNNGLALWFPDVLIPVKLEHSFHMFSEKYPILQRAVNYWPILNFNLLPFATAIAFFLSSEISLSIGLSNLTFGLITIILVSYGVDINTDYDIGGFQAWARFGGYFAYTLILIYSGRFYYWNLAKHALWFPRPDTSERPAVRAVRILFISSVALCLLAIRMGLSWPLAIGTVLLMLMSFLIVARISAETGLSFIQPGWQPFGVLLALFGGFAMGPTGIIISALLCTVLSIDQSQALLPYLSNGLKLAENTHVPLPKLARANLWIYLGGTLVCLAFALIVFYDVGTPAGYDWSFYRLPTIPMRAADPVSLKLTAMDSLNASDALTGWQRLLNMKPDAIFIGGALLGFACVLLFQFMRLHTTWWCLHPILVLCWASYPLTIFGNPILFGWFIKKACLRFGGYPLVNKLKPASCGVIAAEISAALLFTLIGLTYYFITGTPPKTYKFFPR